MSLGNDYVYQNDIYYLKYSSTFKLSKNVFKKFCKRKINIPPASAISFGAFSVSDHSMYRTMEVSQRVAPKAKAEVTNGLKRSLNLL